MTLAPVRRALLLLAGIAALALVAMGLRQALASEPTRIRWRLESMADGFNRTRLAPCLRGVAADWRDADSRIDRARLADVLRGLFMNERDPETRRFPYRMELARDTLLIELDPEDRRQARAELEATVFGLKDGEWCPSWRVRVSAELAKHGELGWQVRRTEHETLGTDGRLVR